MINLTSAITWREINDSGTVSVRQAQVLAVIRNSNSPISDAEISKASCLPINCVTGRRGELVAAGLVEDAGIVKNAAGRSVHVWRPVATKAEQAELF